VDFLNPKETIMVMAGAGVLALVFNYGFRMAKESFNSETEVLINENTGQEIVNNYGEIQKVSTERGIMAGRMVGQTYNLSNSTPYGKIAYGPDLSAYTLSMAATTPSFGQNYTGAAVGAN
jgi:hypothetical protein